MPGPYCDCLETFTTPVFSQMATINHGQTIRVEDDSGDRQGLVFWVQPAWQRQLFGPGTPNWTDLSGDQRAELVKANPRRKIWRLRLGELDVHVKRYEMGGVIGSLKSLFRGSAAASEFENLRLTRSIGVGAPQPLAFGQKGFIRGMSGPSILITATVPSGQLLEEYLRDKPMDEELLDMSAELLGRLHGAGRLHPDLHLANLAVSTDSGHRRKLYLFDLQKLPRIQPACLSERFELLPSAAKWNLACYYIRLSRYMSGREKQRFLKKYLQVVQPGCAVGEQRIAGILGDLERLGSQDRQRRWAKRDARAGGTNKYFSRIRLGGWSGSVLLGLKEEVPDGLTSVSQFSTEQWREALAEPLGLFAAPGVQTLQDSEQLLSVRRKLQVGSTELEVYAKLNRGGRQIVFGLGRSAAQRAYEAGFALLRRSIPTVLPLAWLVRREGLFGRATILITEAMPGVVNLGQILAEWSKNGRAEPSLLRDFFQKAGALAGELVRRGFVHLDFRPGNILVQTKPDGRRRLLLVGLQNIRRVNSSDSGEGLKMLGRAYLAVRNQPGFSHTMRLCFLRKYLEHAGQPSNAWKKYWREIDALARSVSRKS